MDEDEMIDFPDDSDWDAPENDDMFADDMEQGPIEHDDMYDFDSALGSAGFGTDEWYGNYESDL